MLTHSTLQEYSRKNTLTVIPYNFFFLKPNNH